MKISANGQKKNIGFCISENIFFHKKINKKKMNGLIFCSCAET